MSIAEKGDTVCEKKLKEFKIMQLTFEQAILEHRKMWNWIAENIEVEKMDIDNMKILYLTNFAYAQSPSLDCFCCQYAGTVRAKSKCRKCPINWENDAKHFMCEQEDSPYWLALVASENRNYISAAKYAKKVAELPSREKRDDDL